MAKKAADEKTAAAPTIFATGDRMNYGDKSGQITRLTYPGGAPGSSANAVAVCEVKFDDGSTATVSSTDLTKSEA